MKKRLKRYILEGPWEEQLEVGMKSLERWVIWPVIVFAALYFGIACFRTLVR